MRSCWVCRIMHQCVCIARLSQQPVWGTSIMQVRPRSFSFRVSFTVTHPHSCSSHATPCSRLTQSASSLSSRLPLSSSAILFAQSAVAPGRERRAQREDEKKELKRKRFRYSAARLLRQHSLDVPEQMSRHPRLWKQRWQQRIKSASPIKPRPLEPL